MYPFKDYLSNCHETDGGRVMMGNNVVCRIVGIGNVNLKLHDGTIRELREVRYVLELKRNLISLGMLDKWISNGDEVVMIGHKRNEVYVLGVEAIIGIS